MNVGFVSLGCSKNLVDTEMIIGLFNKNNFGIVNDVKLAEIIVINTCGFIEQAKEEAINTILEMIEYKKKATCKYLIVTGCLVQRYKEDLIKELPEVDLFLSLDEYKNIWEIISNLIKIKEKQILKLDYMNRIITTGNATAYLKIAEGCSNYCTYCAIPYIRGKFVSRKMEDILEEANMLSSRGIKEIIIIAQDTTKYGIDLYGKSRLSELLTKLCKVEGIKWIRFLYAYPESITDELINVVKNEKKICKYFDMPVQHINNEILRRMNRKTNKEQILNLISKIRNKIPEAILRTSIIVGFPGETREQFEELYDFVKKVKFNKLGTFKYSKEDGTPASSFKNQIHNSTKLARYNRIMKLQNEISKQNLEKFIGMKFEAIIEAETQRYYIGRTYMDVPEMDGVVYIEKNKEIELGSFTEIEISDINNYDLIAK